MLKLWKCSNGKSFWEGFLKRLIAHTINLIVIILLTYVVMMGLWWFFSDNKENYIKMSILSVVIGVWVSTLINLLFRLPHYNIPDCYSKSARTLIYVIDLLALSVAVYFVFFKL